MCVRWKGGTEMVLNKTAMAIFLMVAGNCVAGGYGTGWKGIPWGSSPADFEKALPEVTDWERAETQR
jgi:hypothetical protein